MRVRRPAGDPPPGRRRSGADPAPICGADPAITRSVDGWRVACWLASPLQRRKTPMKRYPQTCLFAAVLATAIGCTSDPSEPLLTEEPDESAVCTLPAINIDRSLFVSP